MRTAAWLVSVKIRPDPSGNPSHACRRPVEVLTDADIPRFASDARGEGTDDENRMAMSRSTGFFGTYTVDENGEFSGNRVEGATFSELGWQRADA